MSYFRYQNVKHLKRGVSWGDGESRICVRCLSEKMHGDERRRAKQATYIAELRKKGSRFITPLSYCDEHVPEEIR
jgi:hypothetical protein